MLTQAITTQDYLNPMQPKKPAKKDGLKTITEEVKKSDTQKSILG